MARPQAVVPATPLGEALEQHRQARGMTKTQAYTAARMQSHELWNRLLTEQRRFDPFLIGRAAQAVGLDVPTALFLAGTDFQRDESNRIMRVSELVDLLDALEELELKTAS